VIRKGGILSITKYHERDISNFKQTVNLLDLVSKDTTLAHVASTGGGEWAGACPFCGGTDRFRVQPAQGEWFCRGCGENRWHDAIDYIERRHGVGFLEALRILGASEPSKQESMPPKKETDIDHEQWIDAAGRFLENCELNLWATDQGERALAYLHKRGLNDDSIRAWRLGCNLTDRHGEKSKWGVNEDVFLPRGIVIPCFDSAGLHYLKIRKPAGMPKYQMVKGSATWLFGLETLRDAEAAFLFEGEFDAMLSNQLFPGVGSIALPAGQKIKETYATWFHDVDRILVCYDNDQPGQKAADALCQYQGFFKAKGFPQGKDFTELFQAQGAQAAFEFLWEVLTDGNQ